MPVQGISSRLLGRAQAHWENDTMKRYPWFAALLLAAPLAAAGQDRDRPGDSNRILTNLEKAWGDAVVKRDTTAIDRTLDDDYILITPEGQLVAKAQVLKSFKSPGNQTFRITGIDLGEMRIRIFGDTAVVSSRFTLKVEAEEGKVETPFRHTDVFVKRPDGWRCVARQATRIRQSYGHDSRG
ncbi:MAG: hypothetical protein NVSMB9_24480 [Isosphaeraceae bacterium]